jgi:hypothetical protein
MGGEELEHGRIVLWRNEATRIAAPVLSEKKNYKINMSIAVRETKLRLAGDPSVRSILPISRKPRARNIME